jgi:hypothetical protein
MSNIIPCFASATKGRFHRDGAAPSRSLEIRKSNKYRPNCGFLRLHAEVVRTAASAGDLRELYIER